MRGICPYCGRSVNDEKDFYCDDCGLERLGDSLFQLSKTHKFGIISSWIIVPDDVLLIVSNIEREEV